MIQQMQNGFNVPAQVVRIQLGRILGSEGFARARRMQRFLDFIVEETLAGRADQLSEYSVGVAVFDRGDDFEPALDPIVRNDARRLRLKLVEYYRQSGPRLADQVCIDIPKGGYLPVFLPMLEPKSEPERTSAPRLAVLPFEALFGGPENAAYGRAFCMCLSAALSNVESLEVVAPTCVGDRNICESAAEFGLSHAIHGTILSFGERARVILSLFEVAQGTQIWAREYDIDNKNLPAAQSGISAQVVSEVRSRLGHKKSESTHLVLAA